MLNNLKNLIGEAKARNLSIESVHGPLQKLWNEINPFTVAPCEEAISSLFGYKFKDAVETYVVCRDNSNYIKNMV